MDFLADEVLSYGAAWDDAHWFAAAREKLPAVGSQTAIGGRRLLRAARRQAFGEIRIDGIHCGGGQMSRAHEAVQGNFGADRCLV